MRYQQKVFSALVFFVFLSPLTACALSGAAIEGKVLEETTNKPIADAIVVARWQGHLASWGHGKTVCYHALSTTTDTEGRFRFPAWKKDITEDWQKNIRPETVLIDAYKLGYGLPTEPSQKREIVLLKPFSGTRGERLGYLQRSVASCHQAGDSKKNLLPLVKAVYEEARGLAQTEDEKRTVNNLLFMLESIELGYEAAERRDIERSRGRK